MHKTLVAELGLSNTAHLLCESNGTSRFPCFWNQHETLFVRKRSRAFGSWRVEELGFAGMELKKTGERERTDLLCSQPLYWRSAGLAFLKAWAEESLERP